MFRLQSAHVQQCLVLSLVVEHGSWVIDLISAISRANQSSTLLVPLELVDKVALNLNVDEVSFFYSLKH